MTIKIIPDGDTITLTESEHARLMRKYQKHCMYHVDPPTFEEFVRGQRQKKSPSFPGLYPEISHE